MTERGAAATQTPSTTGTGPVPRYEDEDAESLGEKLADLYARRASDPRAKVDDVIEETRRKLRRGPRLRAGEFLKDGQYRLIERVGDSAGDATWQAWDRAGERLVVIKEMVGPWVAKRMRVGTFLEAARTLQGLEHAGLAPIHDATQSRDGFVYLATDWYTGGRLDAFDGDAIDLLQAIVEIGNALQVAHEAGLVHARVRPDAVFFDQSGGARITDFDLAGEHVHGDSGSVFVAPEMVERGAQATAASDVYALAMCALYALNGNRLPYTVVRGPERFIDGLTIPDSVKAVLKRAVDWDLDNRYASVASMIEDLLTDADVLSDLAQRALDKRRHVIASEHFTALWALRPGESVRIKHVLGQIYLQMQTWEEAYQCLSSALEETTRPSPLYPDLREFAQGTGDWKRVADLLWNQARNRPPVARASMRAELARITEHHLDDPRGASEVWTLVVQDHRTVEAGAEALGALKRLAEQRGDWASFVEHGQELLPYLQPEHRPDVQYAIGRAFINQLADEDQGLVWIDRAEAGGVKPLDMAQPLQDIRARRSQWRRLIGLMRLEAENEPKVHAASRVLLRAATIARSVHLEAEAEAIYEDLLERAPQHYPALRELARMRHRSGRKAMAMEAYAALTSTYEGKSEEPEASERSADHTAYARLLVEAGDVEAALGNLEAALRLQGDNIEALRLVGPLYMDTGRMEEGAQALEQLYTLFKAVHTEGPRLDAALQRADAAWYRGRLAVGMRWYNSVLSTVSDHDRAWWGLARIAIAARGGHPGTDRAPWLSATPAAYTAHEVLARLFMGLFGNEALNAWLAHHPLGDGASKAGDTTARAACAVVDVLDRYAFVGPELFERLREGFPGWVQRIDAVEGLFDGSTESFDIADAYAWSRPAITKDFDPTIDRTFVPPKEGLYGRLLVELGSDDVWDVLFGGAQPEPVFVEAPAPAPTHGAAQHLATVDFLREGSVDFSLPVTQTVAVIGSDPACDWLEPDIAERHLRVRRVGPAVYLEPIGGEVLVDGEPVPGWRLMGGESVRLDGSSWTVVCRTEDDARLHDEHEPGVEEQVAGFEEDDSEVTQVNLPRFTPEELEAALSADRQSTEPAEPLAEDGGLEALEAPDDAPADDEELEAPEASEPPELSEAFEPERDVLEAEAPVYAGDSDVDYDDDDEDGLLDEGTPVPERLAPLDLGDDDDDELQAIVAHDDDIPEPVALDVDRIPAFADAPEVDLGDALDDEDDDWDDPEVLSRHEALDEHPPPWVQEDVSDAPTHNPDGQGFGFDDEATVAILPSPPRPTLYTDEGDDDPLFDVGDIVERVPGADDEDAPAPRIGAFVDPPERRSGEDSLGPAGDAPTPQWLAAGDIEPDLVETRIAPPMTAQTLTPPDPEPPPAPRSSSSPRVKGGMLEVMSGPARGTIVAVDGVLALGRNAGCEVHLPADPMLSDVHRRFVASEAGYLIMDAGSDRGTMVDGSRVSEATLKGGETIMVGSTVLRFVVRG